MQQSSRLPRRPSLSADVAAEINQMIFEGRLAPGERINEVRLSESLGVSRTPLREALATLSGEGILVSVPRRGFRVRELTVDEAADVYPIRALLDPEALRLAGVPDEARLERLEEIREELVRCELSRRAVDLDDAWFRELWAACPNPVLLELIERFMRRTRRYELASMGRRTSLEGGDRSKAEIVALLWERDLEAACDRVRRSLQEGVVPVLAWLGETAAEREAGSR